MDGAFSDAEKAFLGKQLLRLKRLFHLRASTNLRALNTAAEGEDKGEDMSEAELVHCCLVGSKLGRVGDKGVAEVAVLAVSDVASSVAVLSWSTFSSRLSRRGGLARDKSDEILSHRCASAMSSDRRRFMVNWLVRKLCQLREVIILRLRSFLSLSLLSAVTTLGMAVVFVGTTVTMGVHPSALPLR